MSDRETWSCFAPAGTVRGRTNTRAPEDRAADHVEFGSDESGVSEEVYDQLATKNIAMVGSDTWGLEPYDVPNLGDPDSFA